ncbi:hypothetical protein [Caldifermentibacillus hisashii]
MAADKFIVAFLIYLHFFSSLGQVHRRFLITIGSPHYTHLAPVSSLG